MAVPPLSEITAECQRLVYACAFYGDQGDVERFQALFTQDAQVKRGDVHLKGAAQIREALATRDPLLRTHHHCSTVHVDLHSTERASGVTYFQLFRYKQASAGESIKPLEPLTLHTVGEYHDEFVKENDGWRIRSRVTLPVFR